MQFIGPPHKLRSATRAIAGAAADAPVFDPDSELVRATPESGRPARLSVSHGPASSRLKIKLDRRTPPGSYRATIRMGEAEVPAHIRVEPSPRLRVSPSELVFDGPREHTVQATLLVENRGNVVVDIPRHTGVGVFDDDGFERAFASVYQLDTDDLEALATHFVAKLREAHGGLLRIRIVDGAGALKSGDARALLLQAVLDSKLKTGRSYHGVLTLETVNCAVRVVVRGQAEVTR